MFLSWAGIKIPKLVLNAPMILYMLIYNISRITELSDEVSRYIFNGIEWCPTVIYDVLICF